MVDEIILKQEACFSKISKNDDVKKSLLDLDIKADEKNIEEYLKE